MHEKLQSLALSINLNKLIIIVLIFFAFFEVDLVSLLKFLHISAKFGCAVAFIFVGCLKVCSDLC